MQPEHLARRQPAHTLELWAGAECTVNRVGDLYFDQMERTGHASRLSDFDRLAALGVRRVRFPILWERTAPRPESSAFLWSDVRLGRLAALKLEPIVGLLHHGSGPAHTSLCAADFATGLAAFATGVAERYPTINAYTPVNEPLTTARFSALYGHWYPHERRLEAFVAALMNQVLATRLAMSAIRSINPAAQLFQTEDLGQIFGTPDLAQQCGYENQRRWLSLDLLSGRVGRQHPLRQHLEEHGASPRLLDEWAEQPCRPDLIGINYYVTSDRFLDSRLQRYPAHTWGGNDQRAYADLEAVRARPEGIAGHRAVLEEAWGRYGTPLALTEVHLASHREDQLRWLAEAWDGARAAQLGGADVRAVTVWSAFGAIGWNNLVTKESGHYEPGAYDVRGPAPRPTALVQLSSTLARGGIADPLSKGLGWWRRLNRLSYSELEPSEPEREQGPRVLVLGAGVHAQRIAQLCEPRFSCMLAPTCAAAQQLLRSRGRGHPEAEPAVWAVILAPDPTQRAPELGLEFAAQWRELCHSCVASPRLLVLSSHRVFSGWSARPYLETDRTNAPEANASWCLLEEAAIRAWEAALIVRTGLLMDAQQPGDALASLLESAQLSHAPALDARTVVAPTFLPHVVDAALDLLVDGEVGIWHLASGACSPFELARRCAERVGLPFLAHALPRQQHHGRGPMMALASARGCPLPDLATAVEAYAQAFQSSRPAQPGQPGQLGLRTV